MEISKDKRAPIAAWFLLAAAFVLEFVANIDYSAVNIALVQISQELHTDLNTLQWVLSGYVLAWGSCVILAGKLADIHGRKVMLLTGTILFALASIGCGFSTQTWQLITSRVLQGLGGAIFLPSLFTMLFHIFPKGRRGMAIGIMGAATGIGLAIGPSFGGLLLEYLNWRWIFFAVIPLVLMAIITRLFCAIRENSVMHRL